MKLQRLAVNPAPRDEQMRCSEKMEDRSRTAILYTSNGSLYTGTATSDGRETIYF